MRSESLRKQPPVYSYSFTFLNFYIYFVHCIIMDVLVSW